ncbi:MAG TPA: PadR family transcriptional regulator [Solirubrobacterales bacterium]|nr:PadR family transcriptional regulator [Solirubrobacterales bacterium]
MSLRFFRHGELPLVLLALLAERPMHGYELMASLKRLFGPRYRPSPGSVYPALEALEAEGLLEGESGGGRTIYRASAAGTEALAERADSLAELELRTGVEVRPAQSLEATLSRFKARLAPLAGRIDVEAVTAVLDRAATEIESQNQNQNHRRPAKKEKRR